MKPQDQQNWQAMLADDPAYAPWSTDQHAADALAFDAWLDSPDGRAWLEAEEFAEVSKREGYGYATH